MKIAQSGIPVFLHSDDTQIVFERGKNAFVYDAHGRKYIDFVLGFGPVVLGHARDDFNREVSKFLHLGLHLPGYTTYHEQLLKYIVPFGENCHASFFKTSSEAVTAAFKISALKTQKLGIIRCGYVGWHDAQIGHSVRWHDPPYSKYRSETRYVSGVRGCTGKEAVFNWISLDFDELKSIVDAYRGLIGAFVLDVYQMTYANDVTIRNAIEYCKCNDILVIADETKTAGRFEDHITNTYKINADFLVLGKAMANGAPLSLLLGRDELMQLSSSARITGTFSKELLGVYCALTTIKILERERGLDSLRKVCDEVVELFNNAIAECGAEKLVFATSIFQGPIFDLRFSKKMTNDIHARKLLSKLLADEGLLILQGHPSFVCLDHKKLDLEKDLYNPIICALKRWLCTVEMKEYD